MPASTTSSNSQALELQQQGQSAYRKGDLKYALHSFSEALRHTTSPELQLSILDHRAAIQERLGPDHYKSALKDARRMMDVATTNHKGYLRAGRILQLMGKADVAVETYRYGLKKVASVVVKGASGPPTPTEKDEEEATRPGQLSRRQSGREMLEGMLRKTMDRIEAAKRKASGGKGHDPLMMLPMELVDMIFQQLPFESLMVLQRVSRGWQNFLTTYDRSYNCLDFTSARKPVSSRTIKTYLSRGGPRIKTAILKHVEKSPLIAISSHCKSLTSLHILSTNGLIDISEPAKLAKNLTSIIIDCQTTASQIIEVIKHAPKLESLTCRHVIPSSMFEWNSTEQQFLPNLESLSLQQGQLGLLPTPADFRCLEKLQSLTFRGTDIWTIPLLPPSLRHLDLSENPSLKYRKDRDFIPTLESLSLSQNPNFSNDDIISMLSLTPEFDETAVVKHLDLSLCPKIDCTTLRWLFDSSLSTHLEYLSLAGNASFSDEVTIEIQKMENLKMVDVSATKVTGIGLCNIAKGENMEWVGVNGCENVGRDAVDRVRSWGVRVAARREQEKGRKVRGWE
ncbi:hypothetical protein FPQ18DRAFT_322635 [Pyronema domesticum]|nr:hypothetical protein FPQ18DRAFT_322635 [Pyronema domesticum]